MKTCVAFLFLLAGCAGTASTTETSDGAVPSVSPHAASPDAGPLPPTLLATSPADHSTGIAFTSDITLSFSAAMDATSTLAAVAISPAVSCVGAVSDSTYTCAHAALSPSTVYTVIVHGTAKSAWGAPLDGERSFSFTTGNAGVTSVQVDGAATTELRQGRALATLTIAGQGLSGVSSALVGTLPATVTATSDSALTLTVVVPHGLAPGPLDLLLVVPGATITLPHAVVVTSIHAAAATGSDAAAGTISAPFATLRQALAVAAAGDTVSLADGIYSAGETWPTSLPPSFVNVPDGVTIVGTSTAGTILTPAASQAAGAIGLVFNGNSGATDLTIHGFSRGIVQTGGSTDLERLHIYGNALDGAYAANNASFEIGGSEIDSNGNAGIFGTDSAFLGVDSTYVHGNTTGAYMSKQAALDSNGSRFDANGRLLAKTHSGVFLTDASTLTIEGTASKNYASGIYSETSGAIRINSSHLLGNGTFMNCQYGRVGSGLVVTGTGSAQMNGGESSTNGCAGVTVLGPHKEVDIWEVTLHANGYANAWFDCDGIYLSQVTLENCKLSDSDTGIRYGDFVNLTVSSTSITNDSFADLYSAVTGADSANRFVDCSFGSDAAPMPFPATTSTVIESTQIGSVPSGPSWSVPNGTVQGASFVLEHS